MREVARIGLVGCGYIARNAYVPFLRDAAECEIVACADAVESMAVDLARDFAILTVCSLEELLADPSIDVILNLTHPAAHAAVNLAALSAGRHVYCEKPFALTREEGRAVLAQAQSAGKLIGCAPDTVLGPGTQAARRAIEAGAIGRAVGARLTWSSGGHEAWHPNPEFYYQQGGGPMLDMGPYFLTALVHLLGPMKSVVGRVSRAHETRTVQSGSLRGREFIVLVPTHYSGVIEMVSGIHVLTMMSFDVPGAPDTGTLPEVMGERGTLLSPDPNRFTGEFKTRSGGGEWEVSGSEFDYPSGRGLGLIDLVRAARRGGKPRASGEIAYHVLDAMLAFEDSDRTGRRVDLESTCEKPDLVGENGV